MAKLPEKSNVQKINEVVYESYPRPHLGGSVIGHECNRYLILSFRWAYVSRIDAKTWRIFRLGDATEDLLVKQLADAGIKITDSQLRVGGYKEHGSGSIDGICELEGVRTLFECKSMNHTNYLDLQRKGVEVSKPQHYKQCQMYMGKFGLSQTLYIAMDKNTSDVSIEIIEFDSFTYEYLLAKEEEIIDATHMNLFPKVSENPSWFTCKRCDARDFCQDGGEIKHNCRTCQYSRIKERGKWYCIYHDKNLTVEEQRAGCDKWEKSEIFSSGEVEEYYE